jgi:hypothetical protein
LRTFPPDRLQLLAFGLLTSIAVCSKHVGYREEREWRVIYLPNYWRSELITRSTQTIGGIPQIVYEVPLKDAPEYDVTGVGIPSLVDRIIIGPSPYPWPMAQAFIEELRKLKVPDPDGRLSRAEQTIRRECHHGWGKSRRHPMPPKNRNHPLRTALRHRGGVGRL